MDNKYEFSYEPVSVYASAVSLIKDLTCTGAIHLDLGCGYAAIARQIEKLGARYVGFDANAESVRALHSNGVEAYELNLSEWDQAIAQFKTLCENYSVITISMLDVIEHLDYDCGLLSRIKDSFKPEQKVSLVLSVPNSSHVDVSVKMLAGSFNYLNTGLLDKTHTVVYTEDNLSVVTRKNGWKQVAANDYHLEFTEQFVNQPSVLLNRDGGLGHDLRQLKTLLDPSCDVYQFVRAYVPDERVANEADSRLLAKDLSLTLIIPESVESAAVQDLVSRLSLIENKTSVQLVLPNRVADTISSDFAVTRYQEGKLEQVIALSLATRYWLFVANPEDVCEVALNSLLTTYDDSRGMPVIALISDEIDEVKGQFELLTAFGNSVSWRVIFPTQYFAHFKDHEFIANDAGWKNFTRRAALTCGMARVSVDFANRPAPFIPSVDKVAVLSQVLSDSKARALVIRSNELANAVVNELEYAVQASERLASELTVESQRLTSESQRLSLELEERNRQIKEMLASNSWAITTPLRNYRRYITRINDLCRAIMRRDVAIIMQFARTIYLKFSSLRTVWSIYQSAKLKIMRVVQDKSISKNNAHALAELSNRRFQESANFRPDQTVEILPEIDISVVSYNSSRWVENFLTTLVSQNFPLSKIHLKVVDNGSADNTVELFERYFETNSSKFASVEVIQHANNGFGAGHDRAIRAGRSSFCLVVNLDLEFLPDSIEKAVHAAMNDADTSAASWEFRQIPYEHPKYYDPVTLETNWSSHACILLKREAYERCGGYDHAIFMYGEDVEFSYRLRSFGYSLKYLPSATVIHYTYEEAGEIKPLQFTGSVLGNAYIRLRYGSWSDRIMAFVLYAGLFIYPSQFTGSKKLLLKNVPKLLRNIPHFLGGRGDANAKFPLRGYDYELIRDGAFWEVQAIDPSKVLPRVTIITRTYRGRGAFLKQAMQSVFNQTYPNIELLIAEDGGDTQKSLVETLSAFAPSTVDVRFLANEKIGRSGVGNAGMATASGEYLMFLDDDDLLFADHVEILMQCLNADSSLDAAYSLAFEVTTNVSEDKSSYVEELLYTPSVFRQVWDYEVMKRHNFIPIQSILFKKSLYARWGGFDLELDQLEDWNLWLRYGYEGNFKFVEKTTSLFRTPANADVRAERHAMLHDAYNMALSSANAHILKIAG